MNKVYCRAWGYTLLIRSNEKQLLYDIIQIRDVGGIPIKFVDAITGKIDLQLTIVNAQNEHTFIRKENEFIFYLDLSNGIRFDCLRNLVGLFVSVVAIMDNKYPLHSAAISIDKKGIILLGKSSSGKTILSSYLCNQLGGLWLANDWSAIEISQGLTQIIKGYDFISFRPESLEHLLPFVAERLALFLSQKCCSAKAIFTDTELEFKRDNFPRRLYRIYRININNKNDFKYYKLDSEKAYSIMNFEMTWVVKGYNSTLYDKAGKVLLDKVVVDVIPPNFDSILKSICTGVEFYEVSGNTKLVGDYIAKESYKTIL